MSPRIPGRRALFGGLLGAVLALLPVPPALALAGTVVDEAGEPIEGAKICYVAGGVEALCVETDAAGAFVIQDSALEALRASAQGYLPRKLPVWSVPEPIVLQLSATLRAWLKNAANGEPIAGGEIDVLYTNGRKIGPFPTSRGGVRVRTLSPGAVRLVGRAEGFRTSEAVPVDLVGGEQTEVTLDLVPAEEKPQDADAEDG